MKCKYCGGEIDKNNATCPFCGSAVSLEEKKELEQINKRGCPNCGSSNIVFRRENVGVSYGKRGSRTHYRTSGICNDCGHTWVTDAPQRSKASKVWLWVLGWIFVFPVPLTILMLRNKGLKPAIKLGIIAGSWLLYAIIVICGNADQTTTTNLSANASGNFAKVTETSVASSETSTSATDAIIESSETSVTSKETTTTTKTSKKKKAKSNKPQVIKVWATKNGKRYHNDKFCSHMKKPKLITLSAARKRKLKPCKICVA